MHANAIYRFSYIAANFMSHLSFSMSTIGLVKHIKTKHKDEPDFEEEMRNAKWRERIMKVSTQGGEEEGEPCPECGKMSKNLKRHMELHQQNRMQIPCPICGKVSGF